MSDIQPSVVYRTGRPTVADYDEAIEALQAARTQLEPDARGCIVCSDCDHQAWECRHNPLVMARRAATMEGEWRCFHCGAVFTDTDAAQEHFGKDDEQPVKCVADLQSALKVATGQLAVANDAAQFFNRKAADAVILRDAAEKRAEALQAEIKRPRFVNPWTIQIKNRQTGDWHEFCHDAPIALTEAEKREAALKTGNPEAEFRVVPWLNSSQRQHMLEVLRVKELTNG